MRQTLAPNQSVQVLDGTQTVPALLLLMQGSGLLTIGTGSVSMPLGGLKRVVLLPRGKAATLLAGARGAFVTVGALGASSAPPTVPGVISGLTATRGNASMTLDWPAPSNGGSPLTDYLIQYKLASEPTTWTTWEHAPSVSRTALVTGLTNGVAYNGRVFAINAVGQQTTASNIATATPATVPSAPTLAATSGNAQATIGWTDGATGGSAITARRLYRSTTGGFTPDPSTLIATSPTFPYVDTGLTNGTVYYYKGIAANDIGDSAASTQQSAAPSAATGGAFTGEPAIAGTRGGTLTATDAAFSGTDTLSRSWVYDDGTVAGTGLTVSDTHPELSIELRNTLATSGATVSAYRGVSASAPIYSTDFEAVTSGNTLRSVPGWAYSGEVEFQDNQKVVGGAVQKTATYPYSGYGGCYYDTGVNSFIAEVEIFAPTGIDLRPIFQLANQYFMAVTPGSRITDNDSAIAPWVGGDIVYGETYKILFWQDDANKKLHAYYNGEEFNFGSGPYDLTGRTLNGRFRIDMNNDAFQPWSPAVDSVEAITFRDATKIQVLTAKVESLGGLGQYSLVMSGINAASSASEYRIERENGEMVTGWTATSQASGIWTASFTIPDFQYQGERLVVKARNVGGTVSIGTRSAASLIPIVSEQKMRISMNDSGWTYYDGNSPLRDLAKSSQISLQPIALGLSFRSFIVGPGDEPGPYGEWDQEYDPLKTYPYWTGPNFGESDQKGWRCMYQGIQYETVSTVNGNVPLASPPIPGAAGPYWQPVGAGMARRDLIFDDTTGLIYRHPVDTNLEPQFELSWFYPEAEYPFTISGACTDGYGNAVTDGELDFFLNGNMTLDSYNPATGLFTITVTRDQTDAEGAAPIIRIKRTGGVIAQMQMIPSYEDGSNLYSKPKFADMTVFESSTRNMNIGGMNQNVTMLHKPTVAKRLKPAATGWTGENVWEYEMQWATAANKDLFINNSYFADADHNEARAIFIRDYPGFTKNIRVEHSNEDWQVGNGAFYQGILLANEATAAGISRMEMKARKHREMMEIWETVFAGQTERLIGVLAWQTFTSVSAWEGALNFENCYQHVREISTAPYHSVPVMIYDTASSGVKSAIAANDYGAFVTAMRADITAQIAIAVTGVKPIWDWLPNYNVSKGLTKDAILMNSYEANHHVEVRGAWPLPDRARTFWNTFKSSSDMSDMTELYIDSMAAECPHHMFMFDYSGIAGRTPGRLATDGSGWGLMKKTGNLTDHPMAAVIDRATYYNAL